LEGVILQSNDNLKDVFDQQNKVEDDEVGTGQVTNKNLYSDRKTNKVNYRTSVANFISPLRNSPWDKNRNNNKDLKGIKKDDTHGLNKLNLKKESNK
jgi:hypothetical protein